MPDQQGINMTLRSTLRRTMVALPLAAAAMVALPSAVSAQTVIEAEGNGTLANAQNLDGFFATAPNPFVTDSATRPHVSVLSGAPEQQYDFYKFSVTTTGSNGTFDIDFGYIDSIGKYYDSVIALLDANGTEIVSNDDVEFDDLGSPDGFEAYGIDSFLTHNFTSVGTYILRVGGYADGTSAAGSNGTYQLQVSLDNAISAVPEASTWAMMLFGFGFMGFAMRRRSAQALAAA
jgi:hypothetical protein